MVFSFNRDIFINNPIIIKPMIKAVIFDLDNVIVNSLRLHYEQEIKTLEHFGVSVTLEELNQYPYFDIKFRELLKKYNSNESFEKVLDYHKSTGYNNIMSKLELVDGIIELITILKKHGYLLGLATMSTKKFIHLVLAKFKINKDTFDSILGVDDVSIDKRKPYPEIYLKSAVKLKVKPNECVGIEDTEIGINTIIKADMTPIGFQNIESGNQDLSKAKLIVESFNKENIGKILKLIKYQD